MKIYVASSWRNKYQQSVVAFLRTEGFEVYDFKHPEEGNDFHWSEIDPDWQNWTNEQYIAALSHPVARAGFKSDFDAMKEADAFVLVLPCGRSAHLELGWAVGKGKPTAIYCPEPTEPELMAKMVDIIAPSMQPIATWLTSLEANLLLSKALTQAIYDIDNYADADD